MGVNDSRNLLNEVIVSGFPELLRLEIQVSFKTGLDTVMKIVSLAEEGWLIQIDDSLRKAERAVLVGGIAHELSHIVRDGRASWLHIFFYKCSARYREAIERDVDVDTILRGFGNELLSFTQYSENKWLHFKEDGLSPREVEFLVNTISKQNINQQN